MNSFIAVTRSGRCHRDPGRGLLFLILRGLAARARAGDRAEAVFLNALFNGITLGGLYFLVASGFTLIFGLMRNVNLAHGSLYLFGGYFGYEIAQRHRKLGVSP
jgi:branched-chain amino acid transport system permease protein